MTQSFVLDTNIAIDLRDDAPGVAERGEALGGDVWPSIVTRVELEGGLYRDPVGAAARSLRLDELSNSIQCHPFDDLDAGAYREIVRSACYSRRKLVDRMIAAQAIPRRAKLVT